MLNRSINLFIAVLAITVIGIESYIYWHVQLRPWQPATPIGRLVFYYSFFTVLSNFMLALSCLWLVFKPNCNRFSFKVIRLNGLVGVIITALVYNFILRAIHRPPNAILTFTNESLHVVLPILGILSWLIWGPFRRINFNVIIGSLLSMLTYGVYIFVRGYFTNQYPYPFINVTRIGYPKALLAVSMVVGLFLGLVFLLWVIERLRKRK
ncbi:hypothetical protein A9G11_01610 [Gilliamella sp. wkB108]|uniref:Pr6Pr family membrane protein n=1 Tax=Gilliamella sp. wkB108 TaxID=3120256 RepID=UPI00080D9B50|nr:Pr6Pr family membrane protein [Gilliamella apicola]OCG26047.1 hypothetical protein A9G11_01610 [Gilliamella apicola]